MKLTTIGLKYNFTATGQVESADVTFSGSSAEAGSISAIIRITEEKMETLTKADFEKKAREKLRQWVEQSIEESTEELTEENESNRI
ncbi:hypothetical protein [Enterococcus hirae]|uniref:hypothetical protein n=1 Tax=Enterococcus hirae TaxID=1354 RepID=UPI000F6F4415|nr:hypothetical protein [Enterococcus hirae]VEE82033.1 Uncharacterised protein [Enterococcus hirae]